VRLPKARLGSSGAEPVDRLRDFAFPAAVAVLTVLAFLPTFENGFVDWDDEKNFKLNASYRGLGWTQLRWMFTTFHFGHYVPLTWLTLGLDYVVWGMDPVGYHLTNLLLHAANAVLFFLIAVRLLALANPALAADRLGLRLAAGAAALLFSLHPLRVESVAWATERRDVLCACFYLLAILAYLRSCDARAPALRSGRAWYGVSLATCGAALLSKSMAVTLPVVLLILDVYPLGRLVLRRRLFADPGQRRVLAEKLPYVLLCVPAVVLQILATRQYESLATMSQLGIVERVSLADFSLAFYLWKSLVPLNLAPVYELPDSIRWWAPSFVLSTLVVLAITGLALRFRRRWPALAAVWAAYVVILLPVSGIVQAGPQIAADRYTYLPCLGWALLAGAGLGTGWLYLRRARPVLGAASRILPVVLVVSGCLGVLTWRQVEVWHDPEALWTQVVSAAPSARAHVNLGDPLEGRGRTADAVAHYEAAIRLSPSYGPAHVALGVALAHQGRLTEAISHYEEAIRLMPRSAVPYNNLGAVLAALGRTDEAIERFREALRRQPEYAEAHISLGLALARQGRQAEAVEHYREALRLRPDLAGVHTSLGIALAGLGRTEEALESFRQAVALRPGDPEARNNLGLILVKAGRMDEALAEFREALRLNPEYQEARNNLDRLVALRAKGAK
jgi:Flp pilus assembly protein TadD